MDSTALLLLASAIGRRASACTSVNAVYVHHHLRPQADADVEHCAGLCERLGVPFFRVDVHPACGQGGLAVAARRVRHAALVQVAEQAGCQWILLAHQSDDVLETILMRMGRGAGPRGIAAIPWVRRATPRNPIRLARPLLSIDRSALEKLCQHCAVTWREDSSNSKLTTARGFLRDQVVPKLRGRWPMISKHALRIAEAGRSGEWALRRIAVREGWTADEVPRALLRKHGPVLSASLLASALHQRSIALSLRTIRLVAHAACDRVLRPRIFQDDGGRVTLNSRVLIVRPN